MKKLEKLPIKILSALGLSITLILSNNAFAQSAGLPAEAAARKAADAELQTLITTLQGQVTALQAKVDSIPNSTVHKIGDQYAGGIIFHVTEDGQHGLIASLHDQDGGAGIQWYNGVIKVTGAKFDGEGAGAMNTALIIAAQTIDNSTGNYAAKLAANYTARGDGTACTDEQTETCYGDWYLPSRHELYLLYLQRSVVGSFPESESETLYWSSTEYEENVAWIQFINDGGQGMVGKDTAQRVRAVRAF